MEPTVSRFGPKTTGDLSASTRGGAGQTTSSPVVAVVSPECQVGEGYRTDWDAGADARRNRPVARRRATPAWDPAKARNLWRYRELVGFLIWRDLKVRYRQTLLGASWAILQPLFTMVVFSIFFGKLAKVPSDGVAYPLFSLAALVPWTFFATSLTQGSNSLVLGANMVKKIYFPRMAMPLAAVLAGLLDLGLALSLLIGMMLYYGTTPTFNLVWLPLVLLVVVAAALGVTLWLSAMNALYRDVRHAVPFLTQAWLFATPIAYPSSLLPEPWRAVYAINPMAGAVEGFRWAVLGTSTFPGSMLLISGLTGLLLLFSGAVYFWRTERVMADVI